MKVVWRLDAPTVRNVYEALRKTRPIAYTTVMTMMNVLESKGYLEKKSVGKAHVYTPTKPRHQVLGAMVCPLERHHQQPASECLDHEAPGPVQMSRGRRRRACRTR